MKNKKIFYHIKIVLQVLYIKPLVTWVVQDRIKCKNDELYPPPQWFPVFFTLAALSDELKWPFINTFIIFQMCSFKFILNNTINYTKLDTVTMIFSYKIY